VGLAIRIQNAQILIRAGFNCGALKLLDEEVRPHWHNRMSSYAPVWRVLWLSSIHSSWILPIKSYKKAGQFAATMKPELLGDVASSAASWK